jgi:hypothetical protein
MLRGYLLSLLISFIVMAVPAPTLAAPQSIHLAWDAGTDPPEPDIAGFKIYWGRFQGGPYGVYAGFGGFPGGGIVDVSGAEKRDVIINDLPEGRLFFVATAYDTLGNESGYSNEVVKDDNIPPATPVGFDIVGSKSVP